MILFFESSRRCADTRKRGQYDQNKESSRSPTRVLEALRRYSEAGNDDQNKESSRSAEKILGSGESTTKIKSPRGALKRYSEARKVPLK